MSNAAKTIATTPKRSANPQEAVIDGSLRPHAFHIAARYWEGRFLEAAAVRLFTRTEENVIDALQRICMLAHRLDHQQSAPPVRHRSSGSR
jgi:hypothetical protein